MLNDQKRGTIKDRNESDSDETSAWTRDFPRRRKLRDAQKLDSSADARATRPRGTWCLSEWFGSKAARQSLQALELSLDDGWKLRMIAGVARA